MFCLCCLDNFAYLGDVRCFLKRKALVFRSVLPCDISSNFHSAHRELCFLFESVSCRPSTFNTDHSSRRLGP